MQQQGHLYQQCAMLTFDECRRDIGLVEDVLKVFCSGGKVPLRKNHEPETRYTSFEFCAKTWLLNSADIPSVPSAMETSHRRRWRCTFMRNSITHDPACVNIAERVFLADHEAKPFCGSPAAVWTWWHDWLWPYMTEHKPSEWLDTLTAPDPTSRTSQEYRGVVGGGGCGGGGGFACPCACGCGCGCCCCCCCCCCCRCDCCAEERQRECLCVFLWWRRKDTEWLLRRMARLTETMSPEDEIEKGEEGEQVLVLGKEAERLVRGTHVAIVQPFFPGHLVNRTAVACNPGVASKRARSDKKLKVDCLLDAIALFPHLIRQVEPKAPLRFQRRMVHLQAFEDGLQRIAGQNVTPVFGTWEQWSWTTGTGESVWDDVCQGMTIGSFFVNEFVFYMLEHASYSGFICLRRTCVNA